MQRVADRLYAVYKVHGNYGRVFRWDCVFLCVCVNYTANNNSYICCIKCLSQVITVARSSDLPGEILHILTGIFIDTSTQRTIARQQLNKAKTSFKSKASTCTVMADVGSSKIQLLCCCTWGDFVGVCTLFEYFFWLLVPMFEHKYQYFLLHLYVAKTYFYVLLSFNLKVSGQFSPDSCIATFLKSLTTVFLVLLMAKKNVLLRYISHLHWLLSYFYLSKEAKFSI